MSVVYQSSNDLVRNLKKNLKPYKQLIKENTDRLRRFPFVGLKKCSKLDICVLDLQSNNFQYNESIDRKINKISKKYSQQTNDWISSKDEELPPKKKRKMIVDSLVDLNLINDTNEELDFEDSEEENNRSNPIESNGIYIEKEVSNKIESNHMNGNHLTKLKDKTNRKTNHSIVKNGFKPEINGFSAYNNNNNNNNLNVFKIPKKSSQSIENIISHAESLTGNTTKRPVDAFDYLGRYLTEDQWKREDVTKLLLTIARNMATNDLSVHMNRFNDLINKIKSLKYIENEFWDQIIFSVDKKKNDSKTSHQINTFLSSLYDFMTDNKICARVVCNESVIIAYRIMTSHPTAKDLIDLQF